MATGTFTYKKKTLKERIKNTKKNCNSFKLDKSNPVRIGTTAVKPYLSICAVGLVWLVLYCGKMYSRHLFPYGGLPLCPGLNASLVCLVRHIRWSYFSFSCYIIFDRTVSV